MHATTLTIVLMALQGGAELAGNPCSPGVQVADSCLGITQVGCCTDDKSVRWCAGGVLCELDCATKPACGWKSGAGLYDCGAAPKGDPSCVNPYSCLVDGCAPAWQQKGCCGCPCESCVCGKDPYCCNVSWDPVCVELCAGCGGCGSPDGCTAAVTPGCNGCQCQECVCDLDPLCCTKKWDSICAGLCATKCDGGCQVCQPDCTGKQCGPDGCLGLCGLCPSGYECKSGKCEKICIPSCAGRDCGLDSCGISSCGKCAAGYFCNKYNKCVVEPCQPVCTGKECGNDGCGGSCGECQEGLSCVDGVCVPGACQPECAGKLCGDDGCGGLCGYCAPGTICDEKLGKCKPYCKPDCLGKACGDDGCGGKCGNCGPGLTCQDQPGGGTVCKVPCFPVCSGKQCGTDHCGSTCGECSGATPFCSEAMGFNCVPSCQPNCLGKECGNDGCGGSCGNCPGNWYCQSGMCVPQCQPQCLVPPSYLSYKQCGWDECPGQNVCGVCPPGYYCAPGYVCVEDKCSCDGKECGIPTAGCPSCGECGEGDHCDEVLFQCLPCQPLCLTPDGLAKACGDDGCGGSCGACPANWVCDETDSDGDAPTWQCEPCVPKCFTDLGQVKQCGSDGCGGTCGQCAPGKQCLDDNGEGICVDCVQQCINPVDLVTPMACGPDSCPPGCMDVGIKPCKKKSDCDAGHQCNALTGMCVACGSCGSCPPGWICDLSQEDDAQIYVCKLCTPNCAGKECGDNGCGGMCGVCPAGFDCVSGICEKECNPTAGCFGKECGPNGCPVGCMNQGKQECGPLSTCPEGLICDPNSNQCVPCKGNCGQCGEDEYCATGYVCLTKPDICTQNKWKCGDDGAGGSCGDCPEGQVCEEHKCVKEQTGEDTGLEDIKVDDSSSPVEYQEYVEVREPKKDNSTPGTVTCPPGQKLFFGTCVKDEQQTEGGGDGGGCNATAGQPLAAALVAALMLLLTALRRRRS